MICDSVEVHSTNNGKSYTSANRTISTAWIEIETYDSNGIYDKVNDNYKASTNAYKKVMGVWIEIPENEAKTILKSNNIRRG
jgi:hypothetical protein